MSSASGNINSNPSSTKMSLCCSKKCAVVPPISIGLIAEIALCIIRKIKIYDMEKIVTFSESQIASMEKSLKSAHRSFEVTRASRTECRDILEKFRIEGGVALTTVKTLTAKLETFEGSNSYTAKRDELQPMIDRVTKRMNFLADAIEKSQKALAEIDKALMKSESEMNSLKADLNRLKLNVEELNLQIVAQRDLVARLEKI